MTQGDLRQKIAVVYTRAGFGEAGRQQQLARIRQQQQAERQQRGRWVTVSTEPLSASQHILHLLLTVFTLGLWAPVWIIRSAQGNPRRVWEPAP
jgi:hypothetical protein